MKRTNNQTNLCKPILCSALVGLACALTTQSAHANDNELRAGAVIQVPFAINSKFPSFDPSRIRVGLTCQYANIQDDNYTRYIDTVLTTTVKDAGNQVYGLEGNIFIEVFNKFNGTAELLGFYGSNDIQGAAGGGYSFADGMFLDVKAMFPYSEIGLRYAGQPEIYGGLKTLGGFKPAQKRWTIDTRVTPVAP